MFSAIAGTCLHWRRRLQHRLQRVGRLRPVRLDRSWQPGDNLTNISSGNQYHLNIGSCVTFPSLGAPLIVYIMSIWVRFTKENTSKYRYGNSPKNFEQYGIASGNKTWQRGWSTLGCSAVTRTGPPTLLG